MIVVKVSATDIIIEGHAGYAEKGKDIVCAAVSVLAQTLISAMESLTKDKIYYVIRDGYIHIEFKNLSEHGKLLVDSFFIGICRVQEMYSEYVSIK